MVVDSSALAALLLNEPDADTFGEALSSASHVLMSAGTYLEIAILADNRGDPRWGLELDALIQSIPIEVVEVSIAQANLARQAYRQYGKDNHAARLNFGDCFAYALAKDRGEPLLFKGQDFALTDIEAAA